MNSDENNWQALSHCGKFSLFCWKLQVIIPNPGSQCIESSSSLTKRNWADFVGKWVSMRSMRTTSRWSWYRTWHAGRFSMSWKNLGEDQDPEGIEREPMALTFRSQFPLSSTFSTSHKSRVSLEVLWAQTCYSYRNRKKGILELNFVQWLFFFPLSYDMILKLKNPNMQSVPDEGSILFWKTVTQRSLEEK